MFESCSRNEDLYSNVGVFLIIRSNKQKDMETIILELRASKGGQDAKLLVGDMTRMYTKAASSNNFTIESITEKSGLTTLCL